MPTCAVTNCWNEAVDFNVGDRLRGSFCEEHQDVAQSEPHNDVTKETERFGDARNTDGIVDDNTESRGEDRPDLGLPAEKIGETPEQPPAGDTVSKELNS